jgi:multiple sugar transport system ATP-binding protein
MDEPLSNLDAKLRVQTRSELIKLHQRLQSTVIYVTHDQVEAMTMGSRIAVLKDGILQQLDTPQTIYERPANTFVAEFIGSPAMNFFNVQVVGSPGEVYLQNGFFRLRVPEQKATKLGNFLGKELTFGIRPEHLTERLAAGQNGHGFKGHANDILHARINVVEMLGSEAIVYLKNGNKDFVAKTGYQKDLRSGQDAEFIVEMEHAHFFNPDNGDAIG